MADTDIHIMRELAKRYMEITQQPAQAVHRALWRKHNSLKGDRPLIYTRAFGWNELPEARLQCQDDFYHHAENVLRFNIFWASLGDDAVFEPWITMPARYVCTGWGPPIVRHRAEETRGSWKAEYPLQTLDDMTRLRAPWHEIDEEATARDLARLSDAIGDILTINLDRGPIYRIWEGDISTELGYLRGIENFMVDMLDNPQGLHRLVSFMSAGIVRAQAQAEAAGDWGLGAQYNQAMAYAEELPDPAPNVNGIMRNQLWCYMAAQEFTAVSPAMHNEFLLQYQLPILKPYGLVAYGCCEDLTRKIDMVRQIPNLRRIAVAPAANVARCAEQIGRDYVLSYRPSPADMVSYGFDTERMRSILRRDLRACRDCHVDITLKDVETVQGEPERVRTWVKITRQVIDELW